MHRGVDVRTTTVRGVRVVTVAQAFVDIAQVASERKVRTALSERAEVDGRLLGAVRDRYCELAPRGGRDLRTLKAILLQFGAGELPDPTALEARLARAMDVPGIPPVEWQAPFPGSERGPQRVDGLIRDWSLIIEADGRAWHTRLEDFERDRRRDAEAAAAGYQTLRFTWHQLVNEPRWVRRITLDAGVRRQAADLRGTWGPTGTTGAPDANAA